MDQKVSKKKEMSGGQMIALFVAMLAIALVVAVVAAVSNKSDGSSSIGTQTKAEVDSVYSNVLQDFTCVEDEFAKRKEITAYAVVDRDNAPHLTSYMTFTDSVPTYWRMGFYVPEKASLLGVVEISYIYGDEKDSWTLIQSEDERHREGYTMYWLPQLYSIMFCENYNAGKDLRIRLNNLTERKELTIAAKDVEQVKKMAEVWEWYEKKFGLEITNEVELLEGEEK